MAKRSVIIRKLKAQLQEAQTFVAAAHQKVDPLMQSVEERTKDLAMARESLRKADAKILELVEQHRADNIQLGEALEEAKKLRYKVDDLEVKYSQLEIHKDVIFGQLREANNKVKELEKQERNTSRLRRRLNNAHEYIGRLANVLRQHNINIPSETMGKWAANTQTAEEAEDLDALAKAAAEPAPVSELHPSKDFYTQVGQPEAHK